MHELPRPGSQSVCLVYPPLVCVCVCACAQEQALKLFKRTYMKGDQQKFADYTTGMEALQLVSTDRGERQCKIPQDTGCVGRTPQYRNTVVCVCGCVSGCVEIARDLGACIFVCIRQQAMLVLLIAMAACL